METSRALGRGVASRWGRAALFGGLCRHSLRDRAAARTRAEAQPPRLQFFCWGEAGVGAVEFALVLPILMALLMGVADFGLAVNEKMRLVEAARAGAQWAYKNSGATTGIGLAVQQAAGLDAARVSTISQSFCGCASGVTVACSGTCGDGNGVRNYVAVTVSEAWTPLIAYPGMGGGAALSGSVTLRVK